MITSGALSCPLQVAPRPTKWALTNPRRPVPDCASDEECVRSQNRTKLAHKAEHAVDLASGAVLAVTVQPADRGDTTSYAETLDAAQREAKKAHPVGIEEVVMDKGYHSGAVLVDLAEREIRSYVPEPERGKRHWPGTRKNNVACTRTGSGCVRSGRSDCRNCAASYANGASRTAMKPAHCGGCMCAARTMC